MRNAHRGALLVALAALLGASPSRAAELTTELKHCTAIAGAEARLACYDALAGRSANGTATGVVPAITAPAAAAPVQAIPAAAAPAAVAPVAAAMAVTAPVPAPAPAPVDPAEAAKNFGLSSAQLHSAPSGPPSIEAHVTAVTVDRALRSYVALDNGQTWASTDGGLELDSGEPVTIKRAALGSFMLLSTTSKHSYHVRRVR